MKSFKVPALRFVKALSVGARTVRPSVEELSWLWIWVATWVWVRRRRKVVYWPALSRIPVKFSGPGGAGAGAVWAWAWMKRKAVRERRMRGMVVEVAMVMMNIVVACNEMVGDFMG